MKIRPLSTIPASACLAALLTLSANAAVGTVNYPISAQKAFQTAVSGLDASDWPAAAAATSVSQPMPTMTMGAAPKADPAMTDELMGRLIKYVKSAPNISTVDAPTCKIHGLCDGTGDLSLRTAESETATDGGKHWFSMPANADSKDILILRMTPGMMESFLTDKTGKLRAAAVQTNGVARLITNEKAAEQFKKEMALFAAEAASSLPPTGTPVAAK